jgi:hypothetical protein
MVGTPVVGLQAKAKRVAVSVRLFGSASGAANRSAGFRIDR